MQLSASITPTDPKLAALLAATGGSLPIDCLTGVAALASNATQPDAFAELLSGATPTSAPTVAVAPGLSAPITSPTAATTAPDKKLRTMIPNSKVLILYYLYSSLSLA